MLAGVLLDVIEAAFPIYAAVNWALSDGAIGEMGDVAILFIEDFHDFRFAKRP